MVSGCLHLSNKLFYMTALTEFAQLLVFTQRIPPRLCIEWNYLSLIHGSITKAKYIELEYLMLS